MKPYTYVAVIGIDGMGNFNTQAHTPCMDRIFANGASTAYAYSMDPTISAENWGGMLLGTLPAVHGLTNGYISCHPYANDALPSVFRRIRAHFPDARLASVVNWEPINIGIVEDGLGVDKRTADDDDAVTQLVLECVAQKPTFLFVQLDNVDGAGHHYGYGTDGHLQAIERADAQLGAIYDAYVRAGIADETLFVCIADHGGFGHGHGGWAETEKYVYLAAAGKTVLPGKIGFAMTRDIAAIVLYALGLPVPVYTDGGFTSQVPQGIFAHTPAYIQPQPPTPPTPRASVPFDAPQGLGSLFADRLQGCFFFDDNPADACGRCRTEQTGGVKYYSNGVRGSAAEFGATGCLRIDGADFSDSFTLAFWLLADADLPEAACVLGTHSPRGDLRREPGFSVLLREHAVIVQYGCGSDDTAVVAAFGTDGFRGWVHVTLTFDVGTGATQCFLDFRRTRVETVGTQFMQALSGEGVFVAGDDTCMQYNRDRGLIFRMDDLLILRGAADDADIEKLRAYYA